MIGLLLLTGIYFFWRSKRVNSMYKLTRSCHFFECNTKVNVNYFVYDGIIGRHGIRKENADELRIINLCITNTVFELPYTLKPRGYTQTLTHDRLHNYTNWDSFLSHRPCVELNNRFDHRLMSGFANSRKIRKSIVFNPMLSRFLRRFKKGLLKPCHGRQQITVNWTSFC